MRMLSLASGWYPHYFVMKKPIMKYYIERPNDRLGLKGVSSLSESPELRRQVL